VKRVAIGAGREGAFWWAFYEGGGRKILQYYIIGCGRYHGEIMTFE
jgi:hypothetical protein